MKKFNIFIVSYCLLLILAIIVNSIIESKTDYTISAIYSTYMIYLVIGAVLLIIVRIIIQLCLIKDNSTASIFIRGIVVIFLIFVGLLTTVFPALIEEKVYFVGYLAGKEVQKMYKAADVAVFPSTYEPFRNSCIRRNASEKFQLLYQMLVGLMK